MQLHPEMLNLAIGFTVVDLNIGANTGDVIHLDYYGECLVVFLKEPGAVGEPPTITLEQAQEIGGTPKALTIRDGYVYVKSGTLTSVAEFTKTAVTTANTFALAAGDTSAIVAFHVKASDLDVANGYNCIKASVAKPGATGVQMGVLLYILGEPRFTPPPAVIAD